MDSIKKTSPHHSGPGIKIWLFVGAIMVVIVVAWALWFYPESAAGTPGQQSAFEDIKTRVKQALGRFEKPAQTQGEVASDPELEELRARVFGDSIAR